jgi:hypothetical protein
MSAPLAARSTASGLCSLVLDTPELHIDVLLLQRPLGELELAKYLLYLTSEWAMLWGTALTIGMAKVDPDPHTDERACIEALDACMSDAAEAGSHISATDALAGFVYAGPVHDLVEYFVPKSRHTPPWHLPIAQPSITLWG